MNMIKRDSENHRLWTIATLLVVLIGGALVAVATINEVAAQSEPVTGNFELGDGVNPTVPGTADLLGNSLQAGPDWNDLFDANRQPLDVYDKTGGLASNGVPDFLDAFGPLRNRRDAAFLLDDISAGSGIDQTVYLSPGAIGAGSVDAAYDLGNAYAYTMFNEAMDYVLYTGLERLAPGVGRIEMEFNQELFAIGAAGVIQGSRTEGDLLVGAEYTGAALTAIHLSKWTLVNQETSEFQWVPVESLPINPNDPAEQCNAGGTICALCNSASVDGGAWQNYGSDGGPIQDLGPDSFMELGINLSSELGVHTYQNFYKKRFVSMQVTTFDTAVTPAAQDYSLGSFIRAARLAGN
ncbi:MAG: hypothetical protein IFK94_05590 [Acidobacteria bacterium]|uniref:Uncharacterized protein n=1 Tax=Candidatus Polarisedimenticola svalbardensis TaxID=2886004 RepID=A0A8J6Y1Q8_9BACT|nr:hypothetical protein [Candidatus Polarisedimenticola svalbardensis]